MQAAAEAEEERAGPRSELQAGEALGVSRSQGHSTEGGGGGGAERDEEVRGA